MGASLSSRDMTDKDQRPVFDHVSAMGQLGHHGKGSRATNERRMVLSMWRLNGDSRSFDGIRPALR